MILVDGREAEVSDLVGRESGNTEELSVGALERVSQEDEEERGKEGDLCWQSSSLAKFSRYLGMPTEGFEGEILFLLKRMKERKLQKGKLDGGGGGEGGEARAGLNEAPNAHLEYSGNVNGHCSELRVGRFLDWGAVDSRGAAGGIVVIWDNRMGLWPTLRRKRESFWEELGAIKGLWNGPWCVAGDFNAILRPEESSRGGSLNSIMRRFAEVIEELELKDLPWSGIAILEMRGSFFFKTCVRSLSDSYGRWGSEKRPYPFRFENMWLKAEGAKLKEWNRNSFGRVEYRKNTALEQMEYWDAKEKTSRLSLEELEARNEAKEEYKKWVLLEEITWRQKSREVWLKEGDRNTGFFHKMANAHRRRNNVDRIKINGVWLTEENDIREGIANAFKTLLSNPGKWRPSVSGLQFEMLEPLDANALETPFMEEEVFDALVGCNGDKAPGPDGFSMAFWLFAWDFVKADVMASLRNFTKMANLPISLVGSLYKWLAKVLANRLKKVVGKVVSKAQGAFVEGLRINLEKSELIPVGRVESMDDLAGVFGCSLGSLPTTYLGMPLGAPFKSVTVWDGVEERFRRRLSMWKRQYLSKGGRATLIRSTLSNLPIYLMSLLCLPSSVRRRLEKIQRDFLWGGGNLDHKPHLVRWELVCLSKAKGGLGVKSLSLLNKTLLAKWNWRFANEREALWNQVIRGRIRADWKLVSDRLAFIVGNGRRVSFWRDRWCGESPLCGKIYGEIQSKRVFEDVEDTVSWTETKSAKISFFAWEATWGKALTLDLVQKRGWALANRCFMCLEKEENINHLLLHCSRTRELWDLLFALFGVPWVLPFSVRETLLTWNGYFLGKNRKKVWRAAPLHIFWTVWKERNRLAFKDESLSIQRLKHSFILTLWAEAKLFIDDCPLTIANFIYWLGSK
ncbi:putative ribonuclease H protein [Vitis vinifera]|nr:putative ribonuclease H protein [Vitis vinifera]